MSVRPTGPKNSPLNILSNLSSVASIDFMKRLLAAARSSLSTPVIWTKVEYNDMSEAGLFYLKAKALDVCDTRAYDAWVDGLVPKAGEVIVSKKYASAFFVTYLATRLRLLGVDTVVICGVSTSGCVRATSLDAMQNGFRPMEIHDASMFDINAKMADAVEVDEAVERLKMDATQL